MTLFWANYCQEINPTIPRSVHPKKIPLRSKGWGLYGIV
jgi:hypothetical protein